MFVNIHRKERINPSLGTGLSRFLICFHSSGQNTHCIKPLGSKWYLLISVTHSLIFLTDIALRKFSRRKNESVVCGGGMETNIWKDGRIGKNQSGSIKMKNLWSTICIDQ